MWASALLQAFHRGLLDLRFCLPATTGPRPAAPSTPTGDWSGPTTGRCRCPAGARTGERSVTAAQVLTMLRHTAEQYDSLGAAEGSQGALPGPAEDALPTAS
jgi:hypothetical protein